MTLSVFHEIYGLLKIKNPNFGTKYQNHYAIAFLAGNGRYLFQIFFRYYITQIHSIFICKVLFTYRNEFSLKNVYFLSFFCQIWTFQSQNHYAIAFMAGISRY